MHIEENQHFAGFLSVTCLLLLSKSAAVGFRCGVCVSWQNFNTICSALIPVHIVVTRYDLTLDPRICMIHLM